MLHPQDCVLPKLSLAISTRVVLPQSHRHSHNIHPDLCLPMGLSATRRPKRLPVMSFVGLSLAAQPHDFVWPFLRYTPLTQVSFPQSHLHTHDFGLLATGGPSRSTVNLPNFCPVTSMKFALPISTDKQPHDRVLPFLRLAPTTFISVPHEHLQSQCISPRFPTPFRRRTVSLPNVLPVMSLNGGMIRPPT